MRFCFFGNISHAIKGKTAGGGELQVFLLARALARAGHDVVIIDPFSNEDMVTEDGIRLYNVPDWNKGIKGLRMFMYRIPNLYKIMMAHPADYYYVRMRTFMHLVTYNVAKKKGAKFILAVASDIDVLGARDTFKYSYKPNFNLFNVLTDYLPSDLVFHFLLKRADIVLLQHAGQKFKTSLLNNNQRIFSNLLDLDNLPVAPEKPEEYFIYAGSLKLVKGVDKLLELINKLDESVTIMIVGLPQGDLAKNMYEQLGKKKNVILKGQKPHRETIELISKAKALINTSYFEGFPNIYLEAWASGTPVISLNVNPGNIFNSYKLGICCEGDMDKMKNCIETNATQNLDKMEMKRYVREFHDLSTAADRFIKVITS